MKNLLLVIAFLGFMGASNTAHSQTYFIYDGSEFSVALTCNSGNEVIINVEFSFGGEWVPFTILDYYDGGADGFVYTVEDTGGSQFLLIYLYGSDQMVVERADETNSWVLDRRDE